MLSITGTAGIASQSTVSVTEDKDSYLAKVTQLQQSCKAHAEDEVRYRHIGCMQDQHYSSEVKLKLIATILKDSTDTSSILSFQALKALAVLPTNNATLEGYQSSDVDNANMQFALKSMVGKNQNLDFRSFCLAVLNNRDAQQTLIDTVERVSDKKLDDEDLISQGDYFGCDNQAYRGFMSLSKNLYSSSVAANAPTSTSKFVASSQSTSNRGPRRRFIYDVSEAWELFKSKDAPLLAKEFLQKCNEEGKQLESLDVFNSHRLVNIYETFEKECPDDSTQKLQKAYRDNPVLALSASMSGFHQMGKR